MMTLILNWPPENTDTMLDSTEFTPRPLSPPSPQHHKITRLLLGFTTTNFHQILITLKIHSNPSTNQISQNNTDPPKPPRPNSHWMNIPQQHSMIASSKITHPPPPKSHAVSPPQNLNFLNSLSNPFKHLIHQSNLQMSNTIHLNHLNPFNLIEWTYTSTRIVTNAEEEGEGFYRGHGKSRRIE